MVIFSTFKVLKNPMQFYPKRGEKKKKKCCHERAVNFILSPGKQSE